jgi:hypothetical protein
MGRFDDITPDDLRADLRHFAELILRLESEGHLLDATPRLLKVLGDLRAKIFAYEVRATGQLLAREGESEELREAQRIIEDAIGRSREAESEWSKPWRPSQGEES